MQPPINHRHLIDSAVARYGLALVVAFAAPFMAYLLAEDIPQVLRPWRQYETPFYGTVRPWEGPVEPPKQWRENVEVLKRVPMPKTVKGIYMSASAAGDKRFLSRLVGLVERTELNTLVIDVKNGNGQLAFKTDRAELKAYVEKRPSLGELKEFLKPLHEKDIYLIARMTVFQDPSFTERHPEWAVKRPDGGLWRDRRGIPWLDPAASDAWGYTVATARAAYDAGFDEVQFDYIRFPSDGNMQAIIYPHLPAGRTKMQNMEIFFKYLDAELRRSPRIPLSIDLFGLVMVQHEYDLNIGQRLRDALPYFDAISPMMYPSHYAAGFDGFANPAAHPAEVIRSNMRQGNQLISALQAAAAVRSAAEPDWQPPVLATFRPWLQDFDMGADYTPAMVRGQIDEAEKGGASGWLLWNAGNVYTEAALVKDEVK